MAIGQLADEPNRTGIKKLLGQLQKAIAAEPSLDELDRTEAMEQVEALAIALRARYANAAQDPGNANTNKTIRRAIKILAGTFPGPIAPAGLKETGAQLLQALAERFGL